jgi:nitroreductase
MDVEHALTTTRTVRRRLDLARPVERGVVEDCLRLALQAPNGSNMQLWRWVLVDDAQVRAAAADIYRTALDEYASRPGPRPYRRDHDGTSDDALRISGSVMYLREHLHEVPVLVVPAIAGELEGANLFHQASLWGSVLPAVWSFMLALRSRGLGTAYTTLHLHHEREAAELLGIPDTVTQVALLPVAHVTGGDFRPADRKPVEAVSYWNRWKQRS